MGFSRITPDPEKIYRRIQAEIKSHSLKFWRPGPKGRKMATKKCMFCNGYNSLKEVILPQNRQLWLI